MAKLKIIGTSHISRESVKEIILFIKNEKPEVVAVELDKDRLSALFSEPTKLTLKDLPKMGLFPFIFGKLGSFVQRKLGEKVGMAPGSDIKSAILAAGKEGAHIYLIDQNIRTTFANLSKKMGRGEKVKFVFFLFGGFLFAGNARNKMRNLDLSKVPPEELIEEMIGELRQRFPGIYTALIKDRDKFMAERILMLTKKYPDSKILVVIGAGHKKGVTKILKKGKK